MHEHVEAILRSKWYPAQVTRVVPPTDEEIENYKQSPDDDISQEDKIAMLDQYGPPPELFKYEVREELDDDERGPVQTVRSQMPSAYICILIFLNLSGYS